MYFVVVVVDDVIVVVVVVAVVAVAAAVAVIVDMLVLVLVDVMICLVAATYVSTNPLAPHVVANATSFPIQNTAAGYFWWVRHNSLTSTSQHGLGPL